MYETVEEFYEKLIAIKNILVNKEVCSIRLVLNPEKIGPYKRILLLPQVYTKLNKISARFTTKNFLEITFS